MIKEFEVVISNGEERTEKFNTRSDAGEFYQKMIDTGHNMIVTLRKVEDFGCIIVNSIIKEWEVC